MPIPASKNIVDPTSIETPQDHSEVVMRGVTEDKVPWVLYRNVYMSTTITGNESWAPIIVRQEAVSPQRAATALLPVTKRVYDLYSGRHGCTVNLIDAHGKLVSSDPELLKQDNETYQAIRCVPPFRECTINVIDAGSLIPDDLKAAITNSIRAGNYVILAYCYSIFSMNNTMVAAELVAETQALKGAGFGAMSVDAIIKKWWEWIPR